MQSQGRECAWLQTPLAAVGFALALAGYTSGQQFLFLGSNDFELTAPQIETISGATQSRLEQVKALVADRQWDEAVDALREIAADDGGRVVKTEEGSFVSLPIYCQMQVAAMPPEGLAAYRSRVDAASKTMLRDGLAARDSEQLNRVAEEMFCSSWGDDALAAIGELALERGDYAGARRAWQAISPQLRDPQGRAPWFALYDVDLARQWPAIASLWESRSLPANWLAYPDTDLNLADVRARLVLASIREGDLARATLELELLRRLHPDATGRLGGVDGPYAPALERLLASARDWPNAARATDWPTFGGSFTRNGIAAPLGPLDHQEWTEPIRLPTIPAHRIRSLEVRGMPVEAAGDVPIRETQRLVNFHPVVVDGRIYFSDGRQIHAANLATGKPAFTADGVIYKNDISPELAGQTSVGGLAAGWPRYTLSAANGVLYARIGSDATSRLQPERTRTDERLVGIDLTREGLLTFQVKPDDGAWSFDGVPVSDGPNVYVAMRHSDANPGAYVACYDAATGRRLWRTFLGAADTPAAGRGDEATHNLLTLVGDRIYANTNLGIVASLDTKNGQVVWLRRYDRLSGKQQRAGPIHFDRELSPCVYDRGLLFVAPADSPQVFALDADTGATVWATDRLAGVVHLLGVVDGTLIASGNQLWGLDARSDHVRFVWPESEHAGVRGFGRGVIAGREVFWPTRDKIYVFDVANGEQTREPIDLGPLADCGANLVAVGGRLLVVGRERIMALGPKPAPKPRDEPAEDVESVAAKPQAAIVTFN
jgi:outer membrane protein assembly factor BamB